MNEQMKRWLENAIFIGFTGTPLLRKDKQTTREVFGMAVLGRLGGGHGTDRTIAAKGAAAARLLRAYAAQVETWRRLRNGGSQLVRVEHVHVNEGGQALIGNVKSTPGPGRLEDQGNG